MNIIVLVFIVIVVLALAVYGIRQTPIIEEPFKSLLILIAVLVAIVVILAHAGMLRLG